jgi:hypothetical protein
MKFRVLILIILINLFNSEPCRKPWNDLKVTWSGRNPSKAFNSLPKTVNDAVLVGWKLEKSCGQVNGNRYILNGDNAVLLIFNAAGNIAGIATKVPKGLPFNFPSLQQQEYFNDEGDFFVITAYFIDPKTVCSQQCSNLSTK